MNNAAPLLRTELSVTYGKRRVLDRFVLEVGRGEIVALIGQSGAGKSTCAMAILRLLDPDSASAEGHVWLDGADLMTLRESQMRNVRGRSIGLVLQSPLSSLNPALRIGTQLREAWRAHAAGNGDEVIRETMEMVKLPSDREFLRRFPSQLSVGQAQRVMIAAGIIHRPPLLIADEPTSALDAITQSEILALFSELNRTLNMAILYISHDLLSVASICHRVAILYEGTVVESGTAAEVFARPTVAYTQRLIAALGAPANWIDALDRQS